MKFIIDRFEGDFAVVELADGKITQIPKCALPADVHEGSVLSIRVESNETSNRKKAVEEKMNMLFKD